MKPKPNGANNGGGDTEVGQMPRGWRTATLGQIANFGTGGTPSRKNPDYWNGGDIPWVKTTEVDYRVIERAEEKITRKGLDNSAARIFPAGTLLVAMYGQGITRGRAGILGIDAATNQACAAITPRDENETATRFIYYFLQYHYENLRQMGHGANQRNLNMALLRDFPIVYPKPDEQRKIAEVLGLVQRAMEQQERRLALTAELKKALLHRLFSYGLRHEPQKQTEIGLVPQSWEQRPLEQAGDVVYGIQAAVASNLKPVGTKILTNKNIRLDGRITLEKINYFVLKTPRHHATVLRKGDLLFNWRSGSKEHVGKTAYFDLEGEFTHSSFILRIRPHDEVSGRYLFYHLNFLRESAYFVKSQTFAVNAKFNKSAINRLPTFLPSEDERREIVTVLDTVSLKLKILQAKHAALSALFRTLLHELMTARIRVHNLNLPELEAFNRNPRPNI